MVINPGLVLIVLRTVRPRALWRLECLKQLEDLYGKMLLAIQQLFPLQNGAINVLTLENANYT